MEEYERFFHNFVFTASLASCDSHPRRGTPKCFQASEGDPENGERVTPIPHQSVQVATSSLG
jgi:hypothetical protein